MSGEWRKLQFSEAVLLNPVVRLERGRSYPFVDMGAVNPGSRCAYANEDREFSGGGSRFEHGDTIMARITPCLENGKIARFCAADGVGAAHGSTEFIVIRGRPDITESDFAYYLTQWDRVRSYARGQMTGTSGRQRVPTNSLDHLTVPVPPLHEQRAIAHILGALDDKIELNRRMNEALETIARALFKSWFVDFDPVRAKMEGREPAGMSANIADLFPASTQTYSAGDIPAGWSMGTLSDVAQNIRRGVSADQLTDATPYIALEHMPRRSIALSEWSHAGGLLSNKFGFKRGEILFGKLRPYFHKVGVAPIDGVCSTDIVVITPKASEWFGFVLGHVSSSAFVDYANAGATGTKMPRTSWNEMSRFPLAIPSKPAAETYDSLIRPLVEKTLASIHESRSLADLRDLLLPKLVSGEIRMKGAA